jgi:hypothetical protein
MSEEKFNTSEWIMAATSLINSHEDRITALQRKDKIQGVWLTLLSIIAVILTYWKV